MAAALLFAAALGLAQPPTAQASTTVAPVTVTAYAPKPTIQAARDFVAKLAEPTAGHQQLARFDDPLCVKVEGVGGVYDAVVAEDIRRVAKDAGAAIDKPVCDTNLLVLFTNDVAALMADLSAKRWDVLGGDVNGAAVKRFTDMRRPVAWWRVTASKSWAGHPPSNLGDPDSPPTYNDARASHIQSNVIDYTARLVVVVDGDKVAGKSLGQIADYVAFAALGDLGPDARSTAPSILRLFDDGAPPGLRLTAWDTAYLKAFYRSFSDRGAYLQEAQIAGQMTRLLASSKPAR